MEATRKYRSRLEYEATAMLLGVEYSMSCHCFFKFTGKNGVDDWIDADTLEPVNYLERHKRRAKMVVDYAAEKP